MLYIIDSAKYDLQKSLLIVKCCEKALLKLVHNDDLYKIPVKNLQKKDLILKISKRFTDTWASADCFKNKKRIMHYALVVSDEVFDTDSKFMYEIISHEMAHLIEFSLRGDSDHGKIWRDIHIRMGGTAERLIDP